MREVAIKSEEQQASRALERSRELLVKQRTQAMNSLRAMLAEFGVVAAQGARGFAELRERLGSDDSGLPQTLIGALRLVLAQLDNLTPAIAALEDRIKAIVKADPDMRRLARIQKRRLSDRPCGGGGDRGGAAVQKRARLHRLGRHDPARDILRRQAANKGREPARGKPVAQTVRPRGGHAPAQRPLARRPGHPMAARHSRSAADESGGDGAGRQDRRARPPGSSGRC